MAYEFAAVTAYIATLAITANGEQITVNDYDGIRDGADIRQLPILQPDLSRPLEFQIVERDSFGPGSMAKQTLNYSIPYQLLSAPFGKERAVNKNIPAVIEQVQAIGTVILHSNEAAFNGDMDIVEDLQLGAGTIGQDAVTDLAGNQFHGARLMIMVTEFIN